MSVRRLRLVAISEHAIGRRCWHRHLRRDRRRPDAEVELHVRRGDEDAIRPGNRVALTASQHGAISEGRGRVRTYVTVISCSRRTPQDGSAAATAPPWRSCGRVAERNGPGRGVSLSVRQPVATRDAARRPDRRDVRGADLTGLSVAGDD